MTAQQVSGMPGRSPFEVQIHLQRRRQLWKLVLLPNLGLKMDDLW